MIYQFEIFRNLTFSERKTFSIHLAYSLIEGIILGVLVLNEFVFVKSLNGTAYQLSLLFQFSVIVMLFSLFLNEFLLRFANKKKLLNIIALITRLPLLLLFFFPKNSQDLTTNIYYHYVFLAVFLIYFLAQPVILPLINLYLKNNYEHKNFGRLYSYSLMGNKLIMLVSTFLFGLLLDYDNMAFRYIYPLVGILGMVSIFLLSFIRIDNIESLNNAQKLPRSFIESTRKFLKIIKQNKAYKDFEIGFMLYGFAFMTSKVLTTLFYLKVLHLNYSSTAFYNNFYNIVIILALPLFGRLIGKIDPRKFAIITFSFLLLTIFFTALTEYIPIMSEVLGIKLFYVLLLGSLFFGLFGASMSLLWHIGSAYFCKTKEVATYQSIHLSLTGVRGLFAPLIGIFLYEISSFTFSFGIGIISLVAAIIVMIISLGKKY